MDLNELFAGCKVVEIIEVDIEYGPSYVRLVFEDGRSVQINAMVYEYEYAGLEIDVSNPSPAAPQEYIRIN